MGAIKRRRRKRKDAFGAEMIQEPTQGLLVTSLKSSLASGLGEKTICDVLVDTRNNNLILLNPSHEVGQ